LHHAATLFGPTVAAQPHELDLRPGPRPVQVGNKHHCTFEESNHDEIVRDRAGDLRGERINPYGNFRRAE
jgi:hypothetical protein